MIDDKETQPEDAKAKGPRFLRRNPIDLDQARSPNLSLMRH